MQSDYQNFSRSTRVWIVLLAALALLSFFAMRRSVGRAMGMKIQTTVIASQAEFKPGDEAKVVVEITSVVSQNIEGNVLEKQSETIYRRGGNRIKVSFDPSTPVVMGKTSDVHPGAVVHITATMGNDYILHAKQIVVLTGYVKVQ
jgi:hypothetical protein